MRMFWPVLTLLFANSVIADSWYDGVWGSLEHRGNTALEGNSTSVRVWNSGLIGRIGAQSGVEWPRGSGDEYMGDFQLLFGASVHNPLLGRRVVSVATSQDPARGRDEVNPANPAEYWTFAPLPGLASQSSGQVARASQPETWPAIWPDTGLSQWTSGLPAGALAPVEETLFWVDDSRDREFLATEEVLREEVDAETWLRYFPDDPASAEVPLLQSFPGDLEHGGLGLAVEARQYQWAETALGDVMLLTYDFHNRGQLPLEDARVGFTLGTLVGGDGDSGDDVHGYDARQGVVFVQDFDDQGAAGWQPVLPGVRNVGVMGWALLETPGQPEDWIDNDGDADPVWPRLDESLLEEMLAPRQLVEGEVVVLVDSSDSLGTRPRSLVRVPAADQPLVVVHGGDSLLCAVGELVAELPSNQLDDNFNGLVDEGGEDLGHAYVDWTLFGLELPAPGGATLVPHFLLADTGGGLDESTSDGVDNDGDWSPADDLGADGRAGTGDLGEQDGLPTNGEPNFEWRDPDEADQLGLTSVDTFSFPEYSSRNDVDLWNRMTPQWFDSTTGIPQDVDLLAACGGFPLVPGGHVRLAAALLFAVDLESLVERLEVVRAFYNSGCRDLDTALPPAQGTRPRQAVLNAPWPNPFNPVLHADIDLPRPAPVRLSLHNVLGERVRTLWDAPLGEGTHSFQLDAGGLGSGVYFLRMEAGEDISTRKVLLVR